MSLLGSPVRTWRTRLGVTGGVSLAALALILGFSALLDLRGDDAHQARFVEYVRSTRTDPLELAARAAASRRLLFLGDVHPAPEPKRFAADLIRRLGAEGRLDAVVLEVPADHQDRVDLYLNTTPEDASLLLGDPEITREAWGASGSLLPVYRAVWDVNSELPPGRRIRIIAADAPVDRAAATLAPADIAATYARSAEHMEQQIRDFLQRHARARLLVFVDGYQTLVDGAARVQAGGGEPVTIPWLAARLRRSFGGDVFGMLTDGTALKPAPGEVAYRGTQLASILADAGTAQPFAVPVSPEFDIVSEPIETASAPGLQLEILPTGYELRAVTDAYIYLAD